MMMMMMMMNSNLAMGQSINRSIANVKSISYVYDDDRAGGYLGSSAIVTKKHQQKHTHTCAHT